MSNGRPKKYVDGVLMDCTDADIAQMEADRKAVEEELKKEQADAQRRAQ